MVVIGNIYDLQAERVAKLRRRADALRLRERKLQKFHEDESGLTVHHELDPALKAEVTHLRTAIENRGIWVAALGGLLLGLLLAAAAWWLYSGR